MRVNKFLAFAIVSLSLAVTACQNTQTDPTSDYKSLSNGIPLQDKPHEYQEGQGQIYNVRSPDANSATNNGVETVQNFKFSIDQNKSVRLVVTVHVADLNFTLVKSGTPEGMNLAAGEKANEYILSWTPTKRLIDKYGNSGTFQINFIPSKSSSAKALKDWKNSGYAQGTTFGWLVEGSSSASRAPSPIPSTSDNKKTTPASAPQKPNTKVTSAGSSNVTFETGKENIDQIAYMATSGDLKVNDEEVTRVDFSNLPGSPKMKCSDTKDSFRKTCDFFWDARCETISGKIQEIKPQYTIKVKTTLTQADKSVTTSDFNYVIKFNKTNNCKAVIKPAAPKK